ncbi:MAG: hypothetical protein PHS95_03130 [Candidatus Pacebacteria bacterium]|nr:hypothetical protein [Candidatus Paceibacterota bacterium]
MRKPFLYASCAALYIVILVSSVSLTTYIFPDGGKETILIPMAMLGLFVLSASVMGFLFFYEPLNLLMENRKQDAVTFFAKTVGIFTCFVILFLVSILLANM